MKTLKIIFMVGVGVPVLLWAMILFWVLLFSSVTSLAQPIYFGQSDYTIKTPSGQIAEKCKTSNQGQLVCRNKSGQIIRKCKTQQSSSSDVVCRDSSGKILFRVYYEK
jgi:hypothetical protein